MRSHDKQESGAGRAGATGRVSASEVALLGIFIAYALIMSFVERMIPLNFSIPGIRLGLANVVVLMAMYLFPLSRAFILMLLKCVMAAFLGGGLSALFYSLGGSLLSFAVMLALMRLFAAGVKKTPPGDGGFHRSKERIGPVGVSVAGAVFHNIGQILVACLLFQSWVVLVYLPVLLLIGIITGGAIGIIVLRLRPHLEKFLNPEKG